MKIIFAFLALSLTTAANATVSSKTVLGHISQGKIDGPSVEVPCSVTFNDSLISITNAGQTSRSCTVDGNSCQLMPVGEETFVMIGDDTLIFACEIKTSEMP